MSTMVVIGGPHDGIRIDPPVSCGPWLRLPIRRKIALNGAAGSGPGPNDLMKTATYHRQEFADNEGVVEAWVHASISSPMKQLLLGYRNKEEDNG